MNKNTLSKIIENITLWIVSGYRIVTKKLHSMHSYDKILVTGTLFVLVLCMLSPLMILSSNTSLDEWPQYVFLITNIVLRKSFVILIWSLLSILMWFFNNKFKTYIVENLWFQGDNYFIVLLLLLFAWSTFVWFWDIVSLLTTYTMILKLTLFYYIALIVIVLLLSLVIYLLFYKSNKYFRWHVVWYHGKKSQEVSHSADWSLFDSLQHDDE
jgi:hypothetical protein